MFTFPPLLPRQSRAAPPTLSLFRVVFYLLCIQLFSYGSKGTQNSCNDLVNGTSTIKAMLHNEHSGKFFLVTSSGHVFIEPISNFNDKADPPTIILSKAKYHLPTKMTWDGNKEPFRANESSFTLRMKPGHPKETWLLIIKQNTTKHNLCLYPKLRLEEEKPTEKDNGEEIYCDIYEKDSPNFFLTFNSFTYGMGQSKKGTKSVYTIIYSFDSLTQPLVCNHHPSWGESHPVILGFVPEEIIDPKTESPDCGFTYTPGEVAVLVHKSIIYVYRKIILRKGKITQLKEQQDDNLQQPKKYKISQFIKCPKTEESEKEEEEKEENDPKTDSQGKQLAYILLGVVGVVLLFIGGWFLFKSKLAQERPRKRKSKPIGDISKALAEWPQKGKASTPSPGKSTAPMKTPSTPRVSTIPEMLNKASKAILRPFTPHSTTPATTTSSPLTRRVSHTAKNPSKTPKSSPAESPASRRQSKASKASPVRPASSPVASRKVTKNLDSIRKSLVKSLAPFKTRKKRS